MSGSLWAGRSALAALAPVVAARRSCLFFGLPDAPADVGAALLQGFGVVQI